MANSQGFQGRTSDLLGTQTGWIHELAKNELHPDANHPLNAIHQLDANQLIEENTVEILNHLKGLFSEYARVLNSYSETGSKFSEIKIYGITNTSADFMIFRNNVKMIFANTTPGIISISFNQHIRSDLVDSSSLQRQNVTDSETEKFVSQPKEIIASVGPFLDIHWTFQGEIVDWTKLVKFYFAEFVRRSRVVKKESQNQILLKQIKSLLQEKGIDI
jgi:hypothetical protein